MFLDKVFFNEKLKLNNKSKSLDSISQNNLLNLEKENLLDVNQVNTINNTLDFLIKMNSSNLLLELYNFMKKQIRNYSEYDNERVLEITPEQLAIFTNHNINLDIFKKEPFSINSILVYENTQINYRYYDSTAGISRLKDETSKILSNDAGLYYLTLNKMGYLGNGVYVCDIDENESCYLFNNLIYDRLNMLSKSSDGYIHFLEGSYYGLIKKCIYGSLKGMKIIPVNIYNLSRRNKEELSLYGEVSEELSSQNIKELNMNLKIQESLPDIRLSSISDEILDSAKG